MGGEPTLRPGQRGETVLSPLSGSPKRVAVLSDGTARSRDMTNKRASLESTQPRAAHPSSPSTLSLVCGARLHIMALPFPPYCSPWGESISSLINWNLRGTQNSVDHNPSQPGLDTVGPSPGGGRLLASLNSLRNSAQRLPRSPWPPLNSNEGLGPGLPQDPIRKNVAPATRRPVGAFFRRFPRASIASVSR